MPFRFIIRAALQNDMVLGEHGVDQYLHLHIGEVQPDAHMRAAAEWHPGIFVTRGHFVRREAQRIEFIRVPANVSPSCERRTG